MSEPIPVVSNDAEADTPQETRQIPGYQILEKLGAGAMAVVFKARQLSLDRIVAIKVLPKRLSADKEYLERFYVEGQIAAKLNHPNIVQAFDVGEAHGYHYFVMEYVEGYTVDDELKKGNVYSEAEALRIGIQVTRALEHAHSLGLIHRDVKPKNIMITTDGTVKLMDLGLARIADDADAIAAEEGKMYGTPYYVSPEQILAKKETDFRCDIYGLGATLYHMVTGVVPFEGEDAKEVMIKHVKEAPASPDRHNLELSSGLCKAILRMLMKKPENRYNSTEELMAELQSIDFLFEVEGGQSGGALQADLSNSPIAPALPSPARNVSSATLSAPMPASAPATGWIIALVISVLVNVVLMMLLIVK